MWIKGKINGVETFWHKLKRSDSKNTLCGVEPEGRLKRQENPKMDMCTACWNIDHGRKPIWENYGS